MYKLIVWMSIDSSGFWFKTYEVRLILIIYFKAKMKSLSPEQIEEYRLKIRDFSNSGQYKKAYALAAKLTVKYPDVLVFAYWEAVYTAEDSRGLTPGQIAGRYKLAAKKLKKLIGKMRNADPNLQKSIRNEYYWFSKQPRKQYLLGVEYVKKGNKLAYYCQGVGAIQVAKDYALSGKKSLSIRWAKKSEKAWQQYFKVMPNWYNSYLFYGQALGIQGKIKQMREAFRTGSKISGIPVNKDPFLKYEREVFEILNSNLPTNI